MLTTPLPRSVRDIRVELLSLFLDFSTCTNAVFGRASEDQDDDDNDAPAPAVASEADMDEVVRSASVDDTGDQTASTAPASGGLFSGWI
jgi:hypothetical protein